MGNTISDDRHDLHSNSKLTDFVNNWALGNNTGTNLNYDEGYLYDKYTDERYTKLLHKRGYCTNNMTMKISLPTSNNNMIVGNFEYSPVNINIPPTETIDKYKRGDYKASAAPNGCEYIYGGLDMNNSVTDNCMFCKRVKNERMMMSDIFKLGNGDNDFIKLKTKLDPENKKNYTDDFISNQFKTYFNAYGRYHIDATQETNEYNDCNCINSTLNNNSNLTTSNQILATAYDAGVNTSIAPKDIVNFLDIKCSATGSYVPDQVNSIGCLEIMNVKNVQVYNDSQAYFKQGCSISTNDKQTIPTAPAGQSDADKAAADKAAADKAAADKAAADKAAADKPAADKAAADKAADAKKITNIVIIFGSASVVILILLIFIKKYIISSALLKH